MAIIIDNSTNTIEFGGDLKLIRKNSTTLEIPGNLETNSLKVNTNGIVFPDNSVQTTASFGEGGSASPPLQMLFNNVTRYAMVTTSGQQVWCVSSSSIRLNKNWVREGTTLTIEHINHGRSVGDRVLVRNTNVDYQNALVSDVPDSDSFSIICSDTGLESGSEGAYSLGFNYEHNSSTPGQLVSGTMTAPINGDVNLHSLRILIAANTRAQTYYTAYLPSSNNSANNGSGQNTAYEDNYIPIFVVRQMLSALTATAATISVNHASYPGYSAYYMAGLGAVTSPIIISMSF